MTGLKERGNLSHTPEGEDVTPARPKTNRPRFSFSVTGCLPPRRSLSLPWTPEAPRSAARQVQYRERSQADDTGPYVLPLRAKKDWSEKRHHWLHQSD